jgi:flagellar basal-body rod protein FlgG
MTNRPLSNKKTMQLLLILTLMVWATQTMLHQWRHISGGDLLLAGTLPDWSSPPQPSQPQFHQGVLQCTGQPLDVAIQGDGFFQVLPPDSLDGRMFYTRAGNFFINSRNHLVLGIDGGAELIPPITIPAGTMDIAISQDGIITGIKPGRTKPTELGQFQLTRFSDPQFLRSVPGGLYHATRAAGPAVEANPGEPGMGKLFQNYLESTE